MTRNQKNKPLLQIVFSLCLFTFFLCSPLLSSETRAQTPVVPTAISSTDSAPVVNSDDLLVEASLSTALNENDQLQIIQMENLIADGNFDVSPTIFKIENARRGQTYTETIYVTSRSQEPTNFYVVSEDYEGSQDASQSHILLGDKESKYGASSWVSPFVSKFTLNFAERLPLQINITVPAEADPGEHYVAVLIAREPKVDPSVTGNRVLVTSRIGVMFMVNVEGDFKADGQLEDFAVKSMTSNKPSSLLTKQPFEFTITYRNLGNVHLTPHGSVQVKNIFGKTVPVIDPHNSRAADKDRLAVNGFNILRDAVRTSQVVSQNDVEALKLFFGPYTAEASIDNGLGQIETVTTAFWYIPMPGSIIVFLVLIILIVTITIFIKKRKITQRRKKKGTETKPPSTTDQN